jgi:hypothetical protein
VSAVSGKGMAEVGGPAKKWAVKDGDFYRIIFFALF